MNEGRHCYRIYEPTELTFAQALVLSLLAEGLTGKEIAVQMLVTERTVRFHEHRLFERLKAKNATHAVAIGFKRGLIQTT